MASGLESQACCSTSYTILDKMPKTGHLSLGAGKYEGGMRCDVYNTQQA